MVLFCQMDVTARSEPEPAAEILTHNLLQYVSAWAPSPRREVLYTGEPEGERHLQSVGIAAGPYTPEKLSASRLLVVGPGGGKTLADDGPRIAAWLKAGGKILAIGLAAEDAKSWLPFRMSTRKAEHISCFFEPFAPHSPFAGVGPADLHNRDPRDFPLISEGAHIVGDGILAEAEDASIVFCQEAPWEFDGNKQPNLKRTHRRASFLLTRLLANMGATVSTPLLERFHDPVANAAAENRCLSGLYVDQPEEWDDPYRFFRW
jgi:hypothetical protein